MKPKSLTQNSVLLALAALIGGCGLQPTTSRPKDVIPYNAEEPLVLGMGYNSVSGKVAPNICVTFGEAKLPVKGADGHASLGKLKIVEDKRDLSNFSQLGVSAGASGVWGNVSASASIVNEATIDDYTTTVALRQKVVGEASMITDVHLLPQYAKLLKDPKTVAAFLERCGDSYVFSVTTGGEYVALLKFDSHSDSQRSAVQSNLQLAGLAIKGSVEVKSVDFEKISSSSTDAHYLQRSGQGEQHVFPKTYQEIMQRLRDFPKIVKEHPVVLSVATRAYEIPDDATSASSTISKAQIARKNMESRYLEYEVALSNINRILKYREEFLFKSPTDVQELEERQKKLSEEMATLVRKIEDCSIDIASCKNPNDMSPISKVVRDYDQKTLFETASLPVDFVAIAKKIGSGDAEFMGNGPKVKVDAFLTLSTDTKRVEFRVKGTFDEVNGDTKGLVDETRTVYTVKEGYEIVALQTPRSWSIFNGTLHNNEIAHIEESENPGTFDIFGDHGGDDVNGYTSIRAQLNQNFRVTLKRKVD